MASFNITSLSTTPETLTSGELGFVSRDGAMVVPSGNAVTLGDQSDLVVYGTITARSAAVKFDKDGSLTVGTGGAIVSTRGMAINLGDDAGTSHIVNGGEIVGATSGIHFVQFDTPFGIGSAVYQTTLINSGKIIGQRDHGAVIPVWDLPGDGGHSIVHNSGTILGEKSGLLVRSSGFYGTVTRFELHNSGLIEGMTGDAIRNESTGPFDVINSGQIVSHNGTAISLSRSVINTGEIIGDITVQSTYIGRGGLVVGTVKGANTMIGGDEGDAFDGREGANLLVGHGGDDTLSGGSGVDRLFGGDGNDKLDGGEDDDTLNANAGDDTIFGGTGNDILVGQDGSDILDGGDGNDTMDGGAGDDTLEGGDGKDILRGRAGEDDLAGGLGRDFLTGGEGADTFIFRALAETVVGNNRDQILDFEKGVDAITVAGLSPGVFEFRGTDAFDPSGNPELRLRETVTGSTIIQIDADGDGTQDAEIRVANVTGLTAEDFVL